MINVAGTLATAQVEIHWGNVGSFLGGVAAVVLAIAAIIGGTAGLQDWRAKQREEKALAEEQSKEIRLNRRRTLLGWARNGLPVYGVKLVTDAEDLQRATAELIAGGPSEYVVLRVAEGGGDVNRAHNLRNLIESEGFLTRAPTTGEYEALEVGREHLLAADGGASS